MNGCRVELQSLKDKIAELQIALKLEVHLPRTRELDQIVCRPRVGVGCVMCCDSQENKVLVGERLGSHGAGKFALPGGHHEYLESWSDCAQKETQEECGISIEANRWQMLHVTNDPMPTEDRHYVTIFMMAQISDAEAAEIVNAEPDKCAGWSFRDLAELPRSQIFVPLQHFLEQGGLEKVREKKGATFFL